MTGPHSVCQKWTKPKIPIYFELIARYNKRLMLSMKADANGKHTKLNNKAFILFVLLFSYLVNFTACFFFNFKKQFSLTWEMNLKIKELNCEKAGFRAIHTENDADMFISWRHIINDAQNFRRISEIFLVSIALS